MKKQNNNPNASQHKRRVQDTQKNTQPIKVNPKFEDLQKPETFLNHIQEITKPEFSINDYKIDVTEELPPPKKAWSMVNPENGEEAILGTLGDFGVIIGKAKSRKSFFISIAISTALSNGKILDKYQNHLPENKREVAYFDTEQSKYYVQLAVKRICTQIGASNPVNLHTYHLRSLKPSERLKFIEEVIYSNDNLGFVVIDGIKDLVTSINSEEEATMIASKLLKWTEEREIFILNVLHQNKSDNNARGHIGTELINKAHTVLSVTKSEADKDISIVEPQMCRAKEPEIFAFEIDEYGIPIEAENFEIRTETKRNKIDATDIDAFSYKRILDSIYKNGESFGYGELTNQFKIHYKAIFSRSLGTNKAKEMITHCKNNDWLLQDKPKAPYTLGKIE